MTITTDDVFITFPYTFGGPFGRNIYMDVFNELLLRLQVAMESGGRLYGLLTTVRVGEIYNVEGNDYLPSLNILLGNIEEKYAVIASGQMNSDLQIILKIHYPIATEDSANIYYDAQAKTGLIPFLEKILDAVNTKQDGVTADPRLLGNSESSLKAIIGPITKLDDKLAIDIILNIKVQGFGINERASI